MKCPVCGGELEQDTVDIGVGEMACGPLGCPDCHWVDGQVEAALVAEVRSQARE